MEPDPESSKDGAPKQVLRAARAMSTRPIRVCDPYNPYDDGEPTWVDAPRDPRHDVPSDVRKNAKNFTQYLRNDDPEVVHRAVRSLELAEPSLTACELEKFDDGRTFQRLKALAAEPNLPHRTAHLVHKLVDRVEAYRLHPD